VRTRRQDEDWNALLLSNMLHFVSSIPNDVSKLFPCLIAMRLVNRSLLVHTATDDGCRFSPDIFCTPQAPCPQVRGKINLCEVNTVRLQDCYAQFFSNALPTSGESSIRNEETGVELALASIEN
jgi:hypothetical protein